MPDLSMRSSFGGHYESHWKHKRFSLTDSFIHINHLSLNHQNFPTTVEDASFEFLHPKGLTYLDHGAHMEAHYQIDRMTSGLFSLDGLSLKATFDSAKKGGFVGETAFTVDTISTKGIQDTVSKFESLDVAVKTFLPHYDPMMLTSPSVEKGQHALQSLQDASFDLDASTLLDGEQLQLTAKLSLDVEQNYPESHNAFDALQELLAHGGVHGKLRLQWENPCVENDKHTVCQLVSAITGVLDEASYEVTDTSLEVRMPVQRQDDQEN